MKRYFIFIYHFNIHEKLSGIVFTFTMVTIVIAPIEVIIKCCYIFVALILWSKLGSLIVITTGTAVMSAIIDIIFIGIIF